MVVYLRSVFARGRGLGFLIAAVLVAIAVAAPVRAAELKKLVVFTQPIPLWDSMWVADEEGYFRDEGLDVQWKMFPSGTTALQTYKSGEGDLILGGNLPGVQYWAENHHDLRLVADMERDSEGYIATSLVSITKPTDLKGKIVATRVGSTGYYFLIQYLKKNGMSPSDVSIKNLDTQVMPTALCQGDIAAFFIWQPYGVRAKEICPDKVHQLSSAEGYIIGDSVLETRPSWLTNADNVDKLNRFLRASAKGAVLAAQNFNVVAKYMKDKFNLPPESIRSQWEINAGHRPISIDAEFYKSYCDMAGFMRAEGMMKEPLDFNQFVSGVGFRWDPKRFTPPPNPC